jgi:hypothetical protein
VLGQVDTAEQVVEEGILWRGVQLGAHPRQRLGGLFFRHVHLYHLRQRVDQAGIERQGLLEGL